jgi:hypothetical protein
MCYEGMKMKAGSKVETGRQVRIPHVCANEAKR